MLCSRCAGLTCLSETAQNLVAAILSNDEIISILAKVFRPMGQNNTVTALNTVELRSWHGKKKKTI